MDDSDKNKVDTIADITPVEFKWDETSVSVGFIAQEIGTIDLSDYTIGANTVSNTGWANGSSISYANIASSDTLNAGSTEYGKTTIKTARSTIDIDELADMMETLKKRLLILAPNFEMHEKYPMLKELYDEYRAMEALLSGPDSNQ
jgi:hypothetical protein